MTGSKRTWRTFLSDSTQMLRFAWQANRRYSVFSVIFAVLQSLFPVASAWLLKLLLDYVVTYLNAPTAAVVRSIVLLTVAYVAVSSLQKLFAPVDQFFQAELRRSIDLSVRGELYAHSAAQEGIAYLEDPTYHDLQQVSSQSVQNAPFTIAKGLTALIQSVSLLASFFGLLLFLSPLLAALVLLSAVPHLLIHFRFGRDRFKLAFDLSPLQRDAFYFSHVLTGLQAAKEMRLFGLRRYLLGRWRQVATQNNQAQRDLQRRELKWKLGLELLSFLVMGLAYYFILRGIFNSQLTVGDIALYGSAVAGVQMGIVALVRATAQVAEVHLFFGQYETIKRLPQPIHIVAAPLPTVPLRQGIVFEDVWFRYRDDAPWVLRGVSFEIPAERCVALVGVNGAGKSTLVKLLTRLYDPTRGRILWDGIDIHNRWLGAGERGTDLSGGQWQRLAIARAFMRSADLLLLDEPTAMLDAAAEAQLVRLFAQMKREHTSLLISHRFSTVKLADHIIVLDGGVVVEHGAHDALMGLGQQYAHLYAAQADLFQHVTGTV